MNLSNLSYQAVKSVSNGVSFHLHRHWHQNCKIVIQDLNLDMADPNHDLTRAHSNYSRCCNSDDSNNCHLFGSLDLATLNWPLVEFDKVQLDLVVVWNDCQVPKYHNKISKSQFPFTLGMLKLGGWPTGPGPIGPNPAPLGVPVRLRPWPIGAWYGWLRSPFPTGPIGPNGPLSYGLRGL